MQGDKALAVDGTDEVHNRLEQGNSLRLHTWVSLFAALMLVTKSMYSVNMIQTIPFGGQ